jgi:hypothetical protein
MDKLAERLPEVITAAAQSHLGILALLSIALSFLAFFFFAKASEKVRVAIFVLLFLGATGFAVAMFRAAPDPTASAASGPNTAALSDEARILLREAVADPAGLILFERYGEGVDLHTNDRSLLTSKADRRALAAWESALEELVEVGLIVERGDRGEVFEVTREGYEFADRSE